MLKNLKRSPLSVFWHCETLARQGFALGGPGALLDPFFLVCNFFFKKRKFSKIFQFSSTVKEYLTLGSLFAIFEPWIWRKNKDMDQEYLELDPKPFQTSSFTTNVK